MNDVYLEEYTASENVRKYVTETAGHGIAYVLPKVYGPVYTPLLRELARQKSGGGLRVLEYGCGGGMNLLWIARYLLQHQIPLEVAVGTDFSPQMTEAAAKEAATQLAPKDRRLAVFHTIANENLARDLPAAMGLQGTKGNGFFDFAVGVNTYRYCFRLKKDLESAQGLFSLLRPGGYSVMIEMNHDFKFFRSKRRNIDKPSDQTYLPTLDQYEAVFRQAGFEIVTKKNFCWVPHSAGPALTTTLRAATPFLDIFFRRYASRSLVVARKPMARP
jgi:SAM-dependent methyltransferase